MYCDPDQFEFVTALEAGWQTMVGELNQLPADAFIPYPERYLLDKRTGWDIFGLYFLGVKIDLNCELCPATAERVRAVPGMITAAFSRLDPGAHIVPHSGKPVGVLRCHLGLDVPEKTGLRVADDIRRWEHGRCLLFDDTSEHEAWNLDSRPRTVLLLDFKAPEGYVCQALEG